MASNDQILRITSAEKNHQNALLKLCRICGQRKRDLRKISPNLKIKLLEVFGSDVSKDNDFEHPPNVCSSCRVTVERCASGKRDLPSAFAVKDFPSVNKVGHCEGDCWVCCEKNRSYFQKTLGNESKVGRPSDKSPLGYLCSKCGSNIPSILGHKCDSRKKAVQNFQHRLERNKLDEPVASKIIKNKTSLKNTRGKPTLIPTKSEKPVFTTEELAELSMKSGGKGGLCRDDRRHYFYYMRKKGVKTPSEQTVLKIKNERCGDLFAEATGNAYIIFAPLFARSWWKYIA